MKELESRDLIRLRLHAAFPFESGSQRDDKYMTDLHDSQ